MAAASASSSIVAKQVLERISKWVIPGTSLQLDEFSAKKGSWCVTTYDTEECFDKCHAFLSESLDATYIVVCAGDYSRDLGLYAMEHPETYVATVEVTVDDEQLEEDLGSRFYEVLGEAQDFDGPAVVVVFVHDIPCLYRYNPKNETPFIPDSGKMSSLVEAFLQREQQTVLFLQKAEAEANSA
jgi:hypothetical protein